MSQHDRRDPRDFKIVELPVTEEVLAEARAAQAAHVERGLELERNFPHAESLFCTELPWRQGYQEAAARHDEVLGKAFAWVESLEKGVEYDLFSDVAGEVTAFHFRTAEMLRDFRLAVGIDPEKGWS